MVGLKWNWSSETIGLIFVFVGILILIVPLVFSALFILGGVFVFWKKKQVDAGLAGYGMLSELTKGRLEPEVKKDDKNSDILPSK